MYKIFKHNSSNEIKTVFIKITSLFLIGTMLGTLSGCSVKKITSLPTNTSSPVTPKPSPAIAPTSSIPASTPSPDVASSSTPEPTVIETQTLEPTVVPTDNGDIDIGIDRWKDNDPVNAREIDVVKFTINKMPFKLFSFSRERTDEKGNYMYDPDGNVMQTSLDPYTNDKLFYEYFKNNRVVLVPTEYMKKLIEERYPGGEFEFQGYEALNTYLVNEKGMSHDESEDFVSEIKAYKDLRLANTDPNIIPVEERFIIPRKDLGLKAEIAGKIMVLEKYREDHKILV